jgi:hypothetical protein
LFSLFGCASNKKSVKPKSHKDLFSDPEIAAFMEGDEFNEIAAENRTGSIAGFTTSLKTRPPWAKASVTMSVSDNFIARVEFSKIGNRNRNEVESSIRNRIRELIAGDVETRVETVIKDDFVSKIVKRGGQEEAISDHIFSVISRHYPATLTFNGVYDIEDKWIDQNNDTLWYCIRFNRTKYINEKEQRIEEEIRKAGEKAYQYLNTSFRALSQESDMEAALTYLGVASYHISKGGGSAYKRDLFHPGNDQNLLVQRHALIKEIDKNIGIRIRNNPNDKFATRAKPFLAEVYTTNLKNYDLNKVQLRINANPDILYYPSEIDLGADGSADIQFWPQMNSFGRSDSVFITFDVISEMIPDKEWYKSDDYTDLLKELPRLELKIMTKEFTPLQTWAFIHSDFPDNLNNDDNGLQRTLHRELGKHSDYFNVISRNNWPINYNRARDYISGKIQFNDLKIGEKKDIQKHDIDVMVEINEVGLNSYDLILSGTNPGQPGGILSNELRGVPGTEIEVKFEQLVKTFISDYFQRKIKLTTPVINKNNDINFRLNGKIIRPKKITDNKFEISEISRFYKQTLVTKRSGYRKQQFIVDSDVYSLDLDKNPISEIKMEQLVPIQGTLTISVLDSLTGKPIRYGGRGEGSPPIIKIRKWYGFFPNPFHSVVSDESYQGTFKLNKLGKYYVSVTKQFYGTPFPKIVTVYDDEDLDNKQFNNKRITLAKQPIGPAIAKSFIVPGWGQWSLGKKTQGISYFTGALVLASWGGIQYNKYLDEVEIYNALKDDYLNSNENWEGFESDLNRSKEKLINHRNQVYGALTSYGLVWGFNLFTLKW